MKYIIFSTILLFLSCSSIEDKKITSTIVDKYFTPETTNFSPTPPYWSSDDAAYFIGLTIDGKNCWVNCDRQLYCTKKVGDTLKCEIKIVTVYHNNKTFQIKQWK